MKLIYIFILILLMSSCQDDFLAVKPAKSLLVPTKLSDFQAILDDVTTMNINFSLTWVSVDDFATTDAGLLAFSLPAERNSYTWAKDILEGAPSVDWNQAYLQVFNSNIVLDGLKEFKPALPLEAKQASELKGAALFYRAMAFYNLLQQFAQPYVANTANTQPGIPLRVLSDINIRLQRASVEESYQQVIGDLKDAVEILPLLSISKTRPVKAAALALLARTYLVMGQYSNALKYADDCLQLNSTLLDYNLSSPILVPTGNVEVIYNCANGNYTFINSTVSGATSDLFLLYDGFDLRKQYYFLVRANGTYGFRQMNAQSIGRFSGLAVDELYLIKSECEARLNNADFGMGTLNMLLINRWTANKFVPYTADNEAAALQIILRERRKELINRGTRWTDLRRLNQDTRFAVNLQRTVAGIIYMLPAKDPRYVYPIPQDEINASGIEQNER